MFSPKTLLGIASTVASSLCVLSAGDTKAILVFELIEQGPNVKLKISGNLTGISSNTTSNTPASARIRPNQGIISTAVFQGAGYRLSGPQQTFGTGGLFNLSSYSGDGVFLNPFGTFAPLRTLTLANGYVQGSPISGTGIINNTSHAGLGISTIGTIATWGIGNAGDTIQIKTSKVPAPLPVLGAAACFAASRRLRARVRASSSSQV